MLIKKAFRLLQSLLFFSQSSKKGHQFLFPERKIPSTLLFTSSQLTTSPKNQPGTFQLTISVILTPPGTRSKNAGGARKQMAHGAAHQ